MITSRGVIIAQYDVILYQSKRAHLYNHLSSYTKISYSTFDNIKVLFVMFVHAVTLKSNLTKWIVLINVYIHHIYMWNQ